MPTHPKSGDAISAVFQNGQLYAKSVDWDCLPAKRIGFPMEGGKTMARSKPKNGNQNYAKIATLISWQTDRARSGNQRPNQLVYGLPHNGKRLTDRLE